uniref:Transferrin-like domain-containing protein n=1 Tax=Ascaris lumbricoides TaxID=6252 RepID=A0A0M3IUW2_ASCLU
MMFEKATSYRACASLYSAVNDDGPCRDATNKLCDFNENIARGSSKLRLELINQNPLAYHP